MRKLAHADRLLGDGKDVADVCRKLQVAEQTFNRWRSQFGGLKANDAKRLKAVADSFARAHDVPFRRMCDQE